MRKDQYKIMYEVEQDHFWYKGMRDIVDVLIHRFTRKKKNLKILDAGCGTGRNLVHFKKIGNVYGIDISSEALKFCRKRGLRNIKKASIEKIPFKDNLFDLVVCLDVFGQQEVKDKQEVLKELYRVLKPGGIIIIRTAAFNWLYSKHDRVVHTEHRYTKNELKKLVGQTNFKLLKITYVNTLLFPALALRRIIDKRSLLKSSDVGKVNPLLNSLLFTPFRIEKQLLKFANLPFGLSLITVMKK